MALSFLPATGHQLPGVYGRHVKLSDNIRGNCLKPCLSPLLSDRCPRVRSCAQPVVECFFFLVALAEMLSLLNSMAGRAVVNHRVSKGPKRVLGFGRRQKLSCRSHFLFIGSHLPHHPRIRLNKLHTQNKFKFTFTFCSKFHVFGKFDTRFGH